MRHRTRSVCVLVVLLLGVQCANERPKAEEPEVSGAFRWYSDLTPGDPIGDAFAVSPAGRTAFAFSPLGGGTVAGVPFTHSGPGSARTNHDLLVAVLEPTGKLAWKRTFSTAEVESATAVTFDDAGDVYVAGLLKDHQDGLDFGEGVSVDVGPGELTSFLVKLRGTDGKALWALGITSGERSVQPLCGAFRKELQVRGGVGVLGCVFTVRDVALEHLLLVTRTGTTEVQPVGLGANGVVLSFDPASGQPRATYVLGGAEAVLRTVALTEAGGVVFGARLRQGTLVDSEGSTPLVLTTPGCLVASLSANLKPLHRRVLGGSTVETDCEPEDVVLVGKDRVLVGGQGTGSLDLGDGAGGQGTFGFVGTLHADLSNAEAFERYPDQRVFGLAADAWGQSFVGLAREASPGSFHYTKRDASGTVVHTSRTQGADTSARSPFLRMRGLAVDASGAPTLLGVSGGPFVFDDGVHGSNDARSCFAVRFAP
ncbi:hypothetical protein MYSTI_00839 [Myxococcus stipitatus DSM 14675]|uniref:Lipoprotein n=1 Tax=Myxococcus stipitatus (strain DSM 14675 / JCM 12634 / Mx s8) TaxID=1278073 RepID=L7U1V7_MYXSD|nr:hypothetical protein [Myxococcus stipitatus]AGC42188.1 hypothetical protein MYSTI_00839 [Myxococcus stipitatus DSM 14675]